MPWFGQQLAGYPTFLLGSKNCAAQAEGASPSDIAFAGTAHREASSLYSPRHLSLPYPSEVVQALLGYFYTLSFDTPNQLSLPVFQSLLLLSKSDGNLPDLRALVVHALHEISREDESSAATIHSSATLAGCLALQIRCLKIIKVRSILELPIVAADKVCRRRANKEVEPSIPRSAPVASVQVRLPPYSRSWTDYDASFLSF